MKTPGPDHPITITPAGQRWRVQFQGHVIADSGDALILKEADYPPVVYFPREDVSMEYLTRTKHATHCPYKGSAAYYSVEIGGNTYEDYAWWYPTTTPECTPVAGGYISFYDEKCDVEIDGVLQKRPTQLAVEPRY